jgi:hypothetical protein
MLVLDDCVLGLRKPSTSDARWPCRYTQTYRVGFADEAERDLDELELVADCSEELPSFGDVEVGLDTRRTGVHRSRR